MKRWRTKDEWKIYSGCGGADVEFITPDYLDVARPICTACPVRVECVQWALDGTTGLGIFKDDVNEEGVLQYRQASEVVVAGTWIPAEDHPDYRETLDKLAFSLENEIKKRGNV